LGTSARIYAETSSSSIERLVAFMFCFAGCWGDDIGWKVAVEKCLGFNFFISLVWHEQMAIS
jgi:hypothetical protein